MNLNDMSVVDLILEGLRTDGVHHKQWFLEQILLRLEGEKEVEGMRGLYEWESGIAP